VGTKYTSTWNKPYFFNGLIEPMVSFDHDTRRTAIAAYPRQEGYLVPEGGCPEATKGDVTLPRVALQQPVRRRIETCRHRVRRVAS
jgi:hypothetical protein